MDLVDKLRAVSADIRERQGFATNEASTRNYLIDPFIRALGFDPNNPNDVEPEFTADFVTSNRKVDYALKKDGKPIIFVEFKAATRNLSFEHTVQLQHYFSTKLDVRFGIVTNGLEYRLFSDIDNPNVMDDEPFLIVDLYDENDETLKELTAFSKSEFAIEKTLFRARQLKYGSIIRQRIESEIEQPSRELVKYLARNLYFGSFSSDAFGEFAPIVERELQHLFLTEHRVAIDDRTEFDSDIESVESPAIRDRIQPFPSSRALESDINIGSRTSQPRLLRDNSYAARRLYEWGTKTAKGFIKNRRGDLKIYDAAAEKHFWVEDESILEGTCYAHMDIEISTSQRVENYGTAADSRTVNVIPTHLRFDFEYKHVGNGRYVVTRIL